MRAILFVLALSLGVAAGPAPTTAAPDPVVERVKKHYQRGVRLYRQGKYVQAVRAFREAQRLRAFPRIHLALGQCYRKLKRYRDALFAYELFLSGR